MDYNNESDEISLSRLFLMILTRLLMIILWGVIGIVLGFCAALLSVEKYPVRAAVNVHSIPGVKSYSKNEIAFFFTSDTNLEKFVDDNHDLNKLRKKLVTEINKDTGYITFHVDSSSDYEFYISLINESVDFANRYLNDEYRTEADKALNKLTEQKEEIGRLSDGQEERSTYYSLIIQERNLIENINHFYDALEFVVTPKTGEQEGMGKAAIVIIGAFLGCCVGGVLTLIAGFNDRKLHFSEDVRNNTGYGKLVRAVPEYKNHSDFDSRHMEYIAAQFDADERRFVVFANSNGAGVETVALGLAAELRKKHDKVSVITERDIRTPDGVNLVKGHTFCDIDGVSVVLAESFNERPSVLETARAADKSIVVLKADSDTDVSLRILDSDLEKLGCRNVSYVFNFAPSNDKEAVKYLKKSAYPSLKFRFW